MSAEPTKSATKPTKPATETTTNSTHGTTETAAQATAHHHLTWCLNRIHRRLDLVKSLLHVLSR
jgi:hypothetical protein